MYEFILKAVHGPCYFGAGVGFRRLAHNAVFEGHRDDGFSYGPSHVRVHDPNVPAWFHAVSWDSVGEGRKFAEGGLWTPGRGWIKANGSCQDIGGGAAKCHLATGSRHVFNAIFETVGDHTTVRVVNAGDATFYCVEDETFATCGAWKPASDLRPGRWA